MKDKIVLITGGTGGIGKQTALSLAKLGARVIITGRNRARAEEAIKALKRLSGTDKIDLLTGDLATRADIHALAQQFKKKYDSLDVLINNAGLVASQRHLTEDGVEAGFAVNVIAPFLLTNLLMDQLKSSPSARVITVSGGSHPDKIELDNLQGERSFVGLNTYSHTKLVMMAVMLEYAQREQSSNVTINVCYPGQASTNMTQNVTPDMMPGLMRWLFPVFKWMTRPDGGKSAAKAARSSVFLVSSPELEGITGKYYSKDNKSVPWPEAVLDLAVRQKLWTMIEQSIQEQSAL